MKEIFYIFIGGGTGSVLRFFVSMIWRHMQLNPRYASVALPWPTLVANVLGCFLIGLFYTKSEQWGLSPETRLMLTTGFCGGFTTFSTFSYEGIALISNGFYGTYALYLGLSIVLGLAAAYAATLI